MTPRYSMPKVCFRENRLRELEKNHAREEQRLLVRLLNWLIHRKRERLVFRFTRNQRLLLSAFQLFSVSAFADGPDLYQHVWRSNGMIYVSAHIPPCHVARFERVVVLPSTNWHESALSAMTVEEDVSTRIVVFSESLSLFPQAFYRVHILRVTTCADFDVITTMSTCARL